MIERTPHVFEIAEYEGFFWIESNSDDIARILSRERHRLFRFKFMLKQEFFIIYTALINIAAILCNDNSPVS